MLLAFQKTNTWHWESLYEARTSCEMKGCAANTEFGSMTFNELWTLDYSLLTFNISFILLNTLIAF